MERCTSRKTSEREIYASQLLRDERIQRVEWENRLRVLFYTFHASLLRCHCCAVADDGLCFIGEYPLSHFLILNAHQETPPPRSRKTLRDAVSWVCAWCAYLYLHIYISLNTHLQNMKNDLCYCILITKQKGPLSWLGESTHRSSRSTTRWERENELNTHIASTPRQ